MANLLALLYFNDINKLQTFYLINHNNWLTFYYTILFIFTKAIGHNYLFKNIPFIFPS